MDVVELVDVVRDEDEEELVEEPLAVPVKLPLPSPTHRLSLPSPKSVIKADVETRKHQISTLTEFLNLALMCFVPAPLFGSGSLVL